MKWYRNPQVAKEKSRDIAINDSVWRLFKIIPKWYPVFEQQNHLEKQDKTVDQCVLYKIRIIFMANIYDTLIYRKKI